MSGNRVVRARWLLVSAAGAVTLAALTDAFLAPARGTTWSDHLVPGFATICVLVAAVAVFLLARDGVAAAVALVLGALALEGAVLTAVEASNVGVRARDVIAVLLGGAGVALVATGVTLLWRSRKGGRRRYGRRAALVLAAVLGAYWVAFPLGMALLATHRPRQAVEPAVLGRPYEHVTLRTADGLRLAAWYVPSRNGAAVVSYPTRQGKALQARMLVRHGYGVLLVDARGYDGSGGAPNAFGWGETKDVDAAVAWLRDRSDVDPMRIGGIGFSVGGEMMLQAAAGNSGLRAVVSEGAGIRSVREEWLYGARSVFALPASAVQTVALAALSGSAPPPSLRDLVGQIAPRPVLLVYAQHGVGGEDLNDVFFRAASAQSELWRVAGAHHTGGYDADPAGYERHVVGFFDRFLLRRD